VPSPPGNVARPTASKMRQALFNILGAKTTGANFLDICAGTGLIGLEAMSRGAASLTAIEASRSLASNIKNAAQTLGYDVEIISGDFRRTILTLAGRKFDIIFADPPYQANLERQILATVAKSQLLSDKGVVVIEHLKRNKITCEGLPLRLTERREYGQSAFSFYAMD
jgi:16S rRNA (guanine966-N2)-methyltransferase